MNVITENRIVIQKGTKTPGMYSAASGKAKDKAKDFVKSGKLQGVLDTVLGAGKNQSGPTYVAPTPSAPTKSGMSTTTKVLICGGVVLAAVAVWYFTKNK